MGKIQKFHKKIKNYTVTECQNYQREEAAIVVTMHYHTHRVESLVPMVMQQGQGHTISVLILT